MNSLKAFLAKLKQQLIDLFDKEKGLFILIAVGVVVVKFRDILISLLVGSAKRVEDNAIKQDAKLASQENTANTQADALVVQAQQEPSKEQNVDKDWYKKK